jgi:hypothetical protein
MVILFLTVGCRNYSSFDLKGSEEKLAIKVNPVEFKGK